MSRSRRNLRGRLRAVLMLLVFVPGSFAALEPQAPDPAVTSIEEGPGDEGDDLTGTASGLVQNLTEQALDPAALPFSYSMMGPGSPCFTDDFNDNSLDSSKWTVVDPANGIHEVNERLEMNVVERRKTQAIIRTTSLEFGAGIDVNVDAARHIAGNGWVGVPVVRVVDEDDPSNWVYILMNMWRSKTYLRDSNGVQTTITNSAPTGWHHYELGVSPNQYTGFLDAAAATVPSNIFANTENVHVRLEYLTGGSSTGYKDRGAFDNFDVCPEEVIVPVTDGFNASDYRPESPAGTTPFGGSIVKPTIPDVRAGASSVSLATGEFVADFPLLHVPQGLGEDFTFALTYRSIGNHDGNPALSWGWDANWLQRLEFNGTDLRHHSGDGRILDYISAAGSHNGPPGTYSRIETVAGKLELKDRDGNRRVFDPAQDLNLTDVYDAAGNHWAIAYPSSTSSTVTDPTGRVVTLTYATSTGNPFFDATGRPLLQSITDFAGRTAEIEYDASTGHVKALKTQGPTSGTDYTTQFTYDSAGHLTSVQDPEGNAYLRSGYDVAGRVVKQSEIGQPAFTFQYNFTKGLTTVTDANDNRVDWNFMPAGASEPRVVPESRIEHTRGLRPTDPAFYKTTWTHNAQDEVTSVTYPAGNSITYAYDETSPSFFARGNLRSVTQDPGAIVSMRDDGRPQTSIVTEYTYDPTYNRVTSIVEARGKDTSWAPQNGGAATAARYTTRIIYDFEEATLGDQNGDGITTQQNQRIVKIIHPSNNQAGVPHAAFAQPGAPSYNNQPVTEEFTWNAAGQLLSHTDPADVVETRTYYSTYSSGRPVGYLRDVTQDTAGGSPLNLKTSFEYTDFGVVNKVTDSLLRSTTYAIDQRGRVTQLTDPSIGGAAGYRTKWTYDDNDNVENLERETDSSTGVFTLTEYVYDGLDRLRQETTHADRTSDINAVALGQCASPCSLPPTSLTATYDYDGNHNLIKRTGASAEVTTWAYDERDLLLNKSGPDGGTYAYDLNGNLAEQFDQLGNPTKFEYDGYDRQTSRTDALGTTFAQNYDPAGQVVRERALGPSGSLLYDRLHRYDESGNQFRMDQLLQVPAGASMPDDTTGTLSPDDNLVTTLNQYDARGLVTRIFNDNYHTTTYAYDDVGRQTLMTDALGNTVSKDWDDNGNLEKSTETHAGGGACPCVMTYTYDEMNRLTSVSRPDGTSLSQEYDGRSNVVSATDQAGRETQIFYDDADRPWVQKRLASGSPTVTTGTHWDAENRVIRKCDGNNLCTRYGYEPATNLLALEGPDPTPGVQHRPGPTTAYIRDENGNARVTQSSSGKTITKTFDALDRPTLIVPTENGGPPTWGTKSQAFTYDGLGRVVWSRDDGVAFLGAGVHSAQPHVVATQEFDTLGRAIIEHQLGAEDIVHVVDGVGNVLSTKYPSGDGRVVERTYDADEHVKTITDPKGMIANYSYVGHNIVQNDVAPGVFEWSATYDKMGRPTDQTYNALSGTVTHLETRYDTGNRVAQGLESHYASLSVNVHSQLWDQDHLFRVNEWKRGPIDSSLTSIASPTEEESYEPDGSNDVPTFTKQGVTCSRSTTAANNVEERCPSTGLVTRLYIRDAHGNLINDGTYQYHWDFKNRLVRVDDQAGDLVVAFAYDAFDRRVIKIFPHNADTGNPNEQGNDEVWYSYSGPHILQEALPIHRGGNPVNVQQEDSTQDSLSTLQSGGPGSNPDRGPSLFVLRQWVYTDLDNPIVMDWAKKSNGPKYTAIGAGDARFFYETDAIGNVVGLVDEDGRLVEGYRYEAYGGVTIYVPGEEPGSEPDVTWDPDEDGIRTFSVVDGECVTDPATGTPSGKPCSPSGNIWFFTGRQYDWEIGSYHYRARQYHPDLGQFMSVDPIGAWGDPVNLGNPYAYAGNNPGSMRDPWGLFTWRDCHGSVRWACQGLDALGTATVGTAGQATAEGIWHVRDNVMGSSAQGMNAKLCNGGGGVFVELAGGGMGCTLSSDMQDGLMFNQNGADYAWNALDFVPIAGKSVKAARIVGKADGFLDAGRHADVDWIRQVAKNMDEATAGAGAKLDVPTNRMQHVLDRHVAGGPQSGTASIFRSADNLDDLARGAMNTPYYTAGNGLRVRAYDTGSTVGWDAVRGSDTQWITVVTKPRPGGGESLWTMHPGWPGRA